MTLLEEQVVDLHDDITVIQGDLVDLDENVDFLFDKQIIQDERLLELEQTSVEVIVELAEINANIQGSKWTFLDRIKLNENIIETLTGLQCSLL